MTHCQRLKKVDARLIDEQGNEKIYVCKDADYQLEMEYLQSKIEAGADCIITQMFFDCKVFDTFVANCRAAGIKIPIIPGIMCVSNYGGFKRMTQHVRLELPRNY